MLQINDLVYRAGDRLLFDGASAFIPAGAKVGLVGRNGAGKSTLLALIEGRLAPEAGSIVRHPRARVLAVAQEAPAGARTVLDAVLDADSELRRLEAEARTATDPQRIAEIHTRLADIDAHSAPARAAAILAGLGFDSEAQMRPLDSFSGGWRMRVALAAVLFLAPDLLLLDEPSNYLDLEGVLWLESHLRTYRHGFILVSHDRSLLNSVVDRTLHLENGRLRDYAGGYDAFERARAAAIERLGAMKARQEAERRRIQAFVDRFRYKASKARQAQSRLKMLARMQPVPDVVEGRSPAFRFPKPEPLSPPLLALEKVAVGYDGAPVLRRLDLRIDPEDRIALLGANGNGKSTFAKLLARRLAPMAGRIVAPPKLRIGYFAQHQADELRAACTPYDEMRERLPDLAESKVRARLGAFGFSADAADRPVATLSGGEKARLLLALMAAGAPQLLILDEPSNHLDIDSREALSQALNDFEGAVILISHDRRLVEATADRLWLVAEGTVRPFAGDLDDYRRALLAARGGSNGSGAKEENVRARAIAESGHQRRGAARRTRGQGGTAGRRARKPGPL
ncbi:MAG: ABC-F family ATP-binding cassette domain-containing protein [Rhodothalassiaceae bacterium]